MIKGPVLKASHPVHPEIAALVADGACRAVDPDEAVSAGVAVIHHPQIFTHLPARRLAVETRNVVLVLHHPEADAGGTLQYDLSRIVTNVTVSIGGPVHLAPVGRPVRTSLPGRCPPGPC